ncbi:MAG: GNAT family N-acetyltransferase [Deltaproteobacteria bacterium]|nr:GNAT family N-acetyltransferase [Deltaproteobacteria bacterium]
MHTIQIAKEPKQVKDCYPVMSELRPHLSLEAFVTQVSEQQKTGYQLAFLERQAQILAVAGFRFSHNLAWGKFIYVDDLVVAEEHRSKGWGQKLLAYLINLAQEEGCTQIHLDSGMHRQAAHAFYEKSGLKKTGFHFAKSLLGHI